MWIETPNNEILNLDNVNLIGIKENDETEMFEVYCDFNDFEVVVEEYETYDLALKGLRGLGKLKFEF